MTPVFKKGNRADVNNYRPVSQTPVSCLVMERIICKAMKRYTEENNLDDPNQHGFKRGHSTVTNLLHFTNYWALAVCKNREIHCVSFDWSKAFDLMPHSLCVSKLNKLGFGHRICAWIGSYLRNRTFKVRVGECVSTQRTCSSGVPQGSILGPQLWSYFLVDISQKFPPDVRYQIYADDLKIYGEVEKGEDVKALQLACKAVQEWAESNGMKLSVDKCVYMRSKNAKHNPCYTVGNLALPEVEVVKDLGVYIQRDLQFGTQVRDVVRRCASLSGLITRCFVLKNPQLYCKTFCALVLPLVTYACEVWRPWKKGEVDLLVRMRRRFVKRVAWKCNVHPDAVEHLIPKLLEVFDKRDASMVSKIRNSKVCDDFFTIVNTNTRSKKVMQPLSVAKSDAVNHLFAWRACRIVS